MSDVEVLHDTAKIKNSQGIKLKTTMLDCEGLGRASGEVWVKG